MLIRLLRDSIRRRTRRLLLCMLAVATSAALTAALAGITLDITGQMAQELRSYGANIQLAPTSDDLRLEVAGLPVQLSGERRLIDEHELVKLKTIFWRNNIVGFAPYLSVLARADGESVVLTGTWFDQPLLLDKHMEPDAAPAATVAAEQTVFRTGVKTIAPWWQVEGTWLSDEQRGRAMVGARLAQRMGWAIGDPISVQAAGDAIPFQIAGLISTGGVEEEQIFVTLGEAQALAGVHHGADRILVSALVEPEANLRADLRGRDPASMTPEQYETWYCSPIMAAVVTQIEEALPGINVEPIRQVSEAESGFLSKIGLLMVLLTLTALAGSTLAVMTAMTALVTERRAEIGLMKAVGADNGHIAAIFLSEATLIGLAGGAVGYVAGLGLARGLAREVFSSSGAMPALVLPITLLLAVAVTLLGSALPVRRACGSTRFCC
jgi:putative ABC transport system permease protein